MIMDSFRLEETFRAAPDRVYSSWLSSSGHSRLTGGRAKCAPVVGQAFTAWDGYISGFTIELDANRRIVQSWRTPEFPDTAPPSRLVITLKSARGGTLLTLEHTQIPQGQGPTYRQGWVDRYFEPMRAYFGHGVRMRRKVRAVTSKTARNARPAGKSGRDKRR